MEKDKLLKTLDLAAYKHARSSIYETLITLNHVETIDSFQYLIKVFNEVCEKIASLEVQLKD